MKIYGIVVALFVALLTASVSAQEIKPTVEVRLEYLMTLEVQMDLPQLVGARRVVNVSGGTLRGPNINGTLVAPSGDWLYNMPDGSSRLDVRLMVKTDDNELIFMEYAGIMAFPKEAVQAVQRQPVVQKMAFGHGVRGHLSGMSILYGMKADKRKQIIWSLPVNNKRTEEGS